MQTSDPILELKNVKTYFFTTKGTVKAVDDISFSIGRGEIVGLVGESGCGKSMTSLSIMGLVPQPAGKTIAGEILFHGENLLEKSYEEMRQIRGDKISMILQDPMVSLNQILSVEYQIGEVFRYHGKSIVKSLKDMCIQVLKKVKVPSPELRVNAYPFQFSGGMCQRTIIGMGVANSPDLLIADEPTTALDVTIQAQVLQLMKQVQEETNAAILMITHDLGTVAQLCSRVIVMYAGRIIEQAPVKTFYKNPSHPYAVGLIKSVPVLGQKTDRLYSIKGQPPNLLNPPDGCRFSARCEKVMPICKETYPPQISLDSDHQVSCWLFAEKGDI
ncbi:MAG: ABC transporter ATP-binding protein [Deltaproteobacteria bacterium]|nr:ABC transporter ATP-binding protein [Deltaproteobacteria bacterium]